MLADPPNPLRLFLQDCPKKQPQSGRFAAFESDYALVSSLPFHLFWADLLNIIPKIPRQFKIGTVWFRPNPQIFFSRPAAVIRNIFYAFGNISQAGTHYFC